MRMIYLLQDFHYYKYLHKNNEQPKIFIFPQIQTTGLRTIFLNFLSLRNKMEITFKSTNVIETGNQLVVARGRR